MCHGRTGFRQILFKIHNLMRQIGVERVSSVLKSQGESLVDPKVWESRQLTAQSAGFTRRPTMGNGVCSRKQRKIFQSLLLITVIFGVIYGGMMSFETHKQLKRTEALALKYQQHQESLSAQLQVVYEHRSRLEKSLQKERVEHKKAKEDFLLFKLEAQQSLSKEKQDGQNKFNSLHSQHQMLKNQHEDLKKQYYELQEQQQAQSQDHTKVLDEHQQKFDQLQETKEMEISKLKGNVYNLREENKQLRKAHQEIHVQLQDTRLQHKDLKAAHEQLVLTLEDHKSALAAAQVQVDEFKHLKETLNKMPSLRQPAERQPPTVGLHAQPARRDHVALPAQRRAAEARDEEKPEGGEVEAKKVEQGTNDVEPNKIRHEQDEDLERNHPDEDMEHNHPDENAVEQERLVAERVEQEKVQHERLQEEQRVQNEHERLRLQRQREEQQHRELREQQLREDQLRNKEQYNMDSVVVHGDEDKPAEGEAEADGPHEEGQRFDGDQHLHQDEHHLEAEVDPADDPNNQGEDEFEEAEQQVHEEEAEEERVLPGHADVHSQRRHRPNVDEQLVMAGNPDQQEDNLEEQYQEEGDEEEQKAEEVGEEEADHYNEENGEQDDAREQEMGPEDRQTAKDPNEENYEEEEEEPEEDTKRRAEM